MRRIIACGLLIAGCAVNVPISVTVSSSDLEIFAGRTHDFTAFVEGSLDDRVTWSVAGVGTIDVSGHYTAPTSINGVRVDIVRARSVTDPSKFGDCAVRILPTLAMDVERVVPLSDPIADVAIADGDILAAHSAGVSRVELSGAVTAETFASAPAAPWRLALASLDGDAVLADRGPGGALWLSLAGGTWQSIAAGDWIDAVAGAAPVDLVAIDATCAGTVLEGPAWTATPISGTGDCRAVALGDFDLDARLDIARLESGALLVTEVENLEEGVSTPVTNDPRAMAVADFDGDQSADVIIGANVGGDSELAIFKNAGSLHFDDPVLFALEGTIVDLAVGDYEGDGQTDVAVALTGGAPSVLLLRGTVTSSLLHSTSLSISLAEAPTAVALGDMTGDGLLDVVVGTSSNGSPVLQLFRNVSH